RVHAAGLDWGLWHLRRGLPCLVRIAGYGLRAPKNPVLGRDLAGVVEAVGKNVTRFQRGDEVFGIGKGSFAEYARARTSSRPDRKTSPSSRRRWSPSPAGPPCKACATTDGSRRGRRW